MKGFLNKDELQIIWRKLDKADLEVWRVAHNPTYVPMVDIGCYAATHGYLELLKWARNNTHIPTCINIAVGYGHLNILQWFTSENLVIGNLPRYVCHVAARNGYLDALKWCLDNGAEWDYSIPFYAKMSGNVELLKWIEDNDL